MSLSRTLDQSDIVNIDEALKPIPGIIRAPSNNTASGFTANSAAKSSLWNKALSSLAFHEKTIRKADGSRPQLAGSVSDVALRSSSRGAGNSVHSAHLELLQVVEKLQRDLHYVEASLTRLQVVEGYVVSQFTVMERYFSSLCEILRLHPSPSLVQQITDQLRSLDQLVSHLKHQMPSMHFLPPKIVSRKSHTLWTGGSNPYLLLGHGVQKVKDKIKKTADFIQFMRPFRVAFDRLDQGTKGCLLCFSVFPANVVIKKRLLKYWWTGEGLISRHFRSSRAACYLTADVVLEDLMSKGFIEPVIKKERVVGFQVNTLVRFVIITLAEEYGFFAFDDKGEPIERFSPSHRVCLVGSEGNSARPMLYAGEKDSEPEKAVTLFNVNDSRPQLKKKWFSKLKNLKVLHLSGWPGSANRFVEIENPEFLKGLKDMEDLQILSLRGISGITELPDSISELKNLKILDLQRCHNLEKLPQKLHKLQNLTHLDVCGCFWFDHFPKEVARLSNLLVLKGFVVKQACHGNSCSLQDLKNLQKLRKLRICAECENFPEEKDLNTLSSFKDLQKLTILWGNSPPQAAESSNDQTQKPGGKRHKENSDHPGVHSAEETTRTDDSTQVLKKLDLQCFPGITLPKWIAKGKLMPRDKLNIIGGNLCKFWHRGEELQFSVRILSLKFLCELRMDWRELRMSFPKLVYLEKVTCPKLTFFPCDENGVWINTEVEEKDLKELGLPWSFLTRATA